jgi:hypothetical protein
MTPLHAAVMSGVPTAAWFFIEDMDHGGYIPIDVNDKANALGVTPLIIAAEAGDANLVTYLILYGVDVNATDAKGYTALTRAGPKGDDKLINILLRSHASCQEIDPAWKADCDKRKAALGL